MIWMDVDTALGEVPVNLVPLTDDTDFKTIETAVAYNAAGLALYWHFVTTAGVETTTQVTPTTAGVYDWAHAGQGMYTIEIPASGGGSINNDTEGWGYFTGVATGVLPWRGPTIGFRAAGLNNLLVDNAHSATRGLAGTALPDAAADAAGGLPISDAGGLDLDAKLANTNEITAARMGALTDWINGGRLDLLLDAIKAVTDALPDGGALTSLATQALLTTVAGYIDTEVAAIKAVTDLLPDAGALTSIAQASALATLATRLDGLVIAAGTVGATGNDTTHVHLSGLAYADDGINSLLLVLKDVSTGLYHARWIEGFVDATDLATIAALPASPQASTDLYWVLPIRADVTGGSGLDAAGVRAAIGLATANLDTQLGGIDTAAAAIKAVTDLLPNGGALTSLATQALLTTVAGYIDTEVAAIKAVTDLLPNAGALTSIAQATDMATALSNLTTLLSRVTAAVALASVCTETRLAELDAANLPADLDTVKAKANLLPEGPAKNTAFTYTVLMVDATDGVTPETGLTVTGRRSLDGGAIAAMTGTITEISDGYYKVAASAADMNGDTVLHELTATGARAVVLEFVTTA